MDGLFFVQFRKYVDKKLGGESWNRMLKESGIGTKTYVVSAEHPDQEAVDLVSAVSNATGISVTYGKA